MEYRDEKNTSIGAQVTDKTVSFELKGDLSLPDYLGEVSRLLWVRPTVLPPTKFLGSGNAEFSGRICYDALYAGADGKLYHADMEDTYAFSVPTPVTRAELLSAVVCPDVMVGRVAAPRKLLLRCRLHAHVCGYDEKQIGAVLPPEAEESVCRLGAVAECGKLSLARGEAIDLYDEVDLGDTDGVEVISSRAEVFLPEVSAHAGAVRCRGEGIVTLLCCKKGRADDTDENEEGAMPYTVERRLPLSFEVPLEDVSVEHMARATLSVEEVRAVEHEGKISIALRLVPEVEAMCREPVAYTKDLFMPGFDTDCRRSEEKIFIPEVCGNKNFSVSGSFPLAQTGMPEGAVVIDVVGEAEVKEKNTDGKSIVLSGDIHCHVLWRGGGEFGVSDLLLPFRVSTEGRFEALSVSATVPILCAGWERDQLRVDAELLCSLRATGFATVAPVSGATFSPRKSGRTHDLLLCYPAAGESLWEISRRFGVPPHDIAAASGIDGDDPASLEALNGVQFLMIPEVK